MLVLAQGNVTQHNCTANVSAAYHLSEQGVSAYHSSEKEVPHIWSNLNIPLLLRSQKCTSGNHSGLILSQMIDLLATIDNILHSLVSRSAACHTGIPRRNEHLLCFISSVCCQIKIFCLASWYL